MPDPSADPAARADYWLNRAEQEYGDHRYEQSAAAAHLASAWAKRAELDLLVRDELVMEGMRDSLSLDALGLNGPTGRDLRLVTEQ